MSWHSTNPNTRTTGRYQHQCMQNSHTLNAYWYFFHQQYDFGIILYHRTSVCSTVQFWIHLFLYCSDCTFLTSFFLLCFWNCITKQCNISERNWTHVRVYLEDKDERTDRSVGVNCMKESNLQINVPVYLIILPHSLFYPLSAELHTTITE